jgi:hypothetical protein
VPHGERFLNNPVDTTSYRYATDLSLYWHAMALRNTPCSRRTTILRAHLPPRRHSRPRSHPWHRHPRPPKNGQEIKKCLFSCICEINDVILQPINNANIE